MGPFRHLAVLLALAGVTSACVSIELPAAPLLVRVEVRARQDPPARPLTFRLAHAQSAQALEHVLTLPSKAWGRAPGSRAHGLLALDGWEMELERRPRRCAVYFVPPLLTSLCDRAEYLAVELPGAGLWAFEIRNGVVDGRIVRQTSAPAQRIDVKWSATSQPYPGATQDVLLLDVALP